MRSVDISPLGHIRPILEEESARVACTQCRDAAARWELGEVGKPAQHFVCSTCFLYELEPMRLQRDSVDRLIHEIEHIVLSRFGMDERSRLAVAEDADRVVYGLIAAKRYEESRGLQ